MARRIVEAASEKQATDIVLLDARPVLSFTDFLVICSAESGRQLEAIAEDVDRLLTDSGSKTHRREGSNDSGWILIDARDVVVHIFDPATRAYYGFDALWEKAPALMRVQ